MLSRGVIFTQIIGQGCGWSGGCRCAISWYDLDLTFDLAALTLTFKILSRLYLGICNV